MNTQTFLMLLALFATITSLITEAAKKTLDSLGVKCAPNFVVLVSSILTGGIGMTIFYVMNGIPFTIENGAFIFVMVVANWVGSMCGYDKFKQLFTQVRGK